MIGKRTIGHLVVLGIAFAMAMLLAAWEALARSDSFTAFLVGQPSLIARTLAADVMGARLVGDVAYTLSSALVGLLIGAVVGASAGLAVVYSRAGDRALSPALNVLSAIPLFAIGPMTIFWFGQGFASKVFLAALASGLLAAALTYQHARSTPQSMRDLVAAMSKRHREVFRRVVVPYASLSLLTNTRALLGMAASGAVIGEFLGSDKGVGHYIVVAEGLFDVNRIWAGVVALSLGTAALAWAAVRLEHFARARL